ncbi:ESX secretion-associated protein EspG [Gordonia sp. ABSL1-1]|uniref:ESX secretion-associated protein EspG n=1 Tax=Gordonia sp. ABSL1-1 TaxID=3053923 RepID=UPI00257399EC|nr:ESX secretion-associated protein EspG [Gordonia sp. ABSL1-1]MDL9937746.1 ESX secretion-associated protein EspG [Gordonia sp. ABSL1-1]
MRPVAFKELWTEFDYENLPYPFQVRPTSATIGEYNRERLEAMEEAVKTLDEWYAPAIEALTNPEVRVEMFGWWPSDRFRGHIGVRGEIACIAIQSPSAADDIGGEVTLRAVRTGDIGQAMAKILDVQPCTPPLEWRFAAATANADEQAKARELATVMSTGERAILPIGFLAGPAIDWRAEPDSQTFGLKRVRKYGDFIVNDSAKQVVSATPERTAGAFDTYIAAVKKVYEQRR